eukprot:g12771.t2
MPPADRRALLALHNAADGPNWVNRSNWDTDVALSLWYKVTVNDQDRVVKLYLARNHLRGSIPNELVTLSELRELELAHNQLTGPIPAELGNLSALKKLSLANNQLSGPIPPELGKLAALEGLSLSNNQLTGSIPPQLGQLGALRHLDLSNNKLDGSIPPELGKLAALQILSLSDNQLTGHIPQQLGNLSALGDLNLSWNKLNGATPPEVGNLVALQTLKLEWNRLSGSIPPELGKLAALQRLSLSNNQLTGRIPEELGKLTALRKLFLSGNQLSGAIPPKLGTLVALRNLRLSNNQLTGSIPPELGKLEALISLSLAGNQLRGTIPPELGNLAALQTLNLGWNRLSGTIQPELGDLRQLQSLVLTENHLTGSIPPELGKLAALKHLILRENQLTRLWDVLGQEKDGSRADRPGSLPVALTSLLDSFARFFGGFLSLDQNPWEHPPEAIVTDGIPAVRAYFEAIYRGGATSVTRPLKVVILGKETVGKTSLRRSIKSGRPCMTKDGGAESTVHVDAEHHDVEGQRIRIFDCAGQVVYYGLLQLFLTPRAVYLLVWDAAEASEMVDLNLESLAIAPWLSGAGDTRAVTMCLPLSYQLALDMLEELASSSRVAVEHQSPGMTRSSLEEKWLTKVDELKRAGTPVAAPEAAMSGAILIRKWEGGLVEYGNFIFLDVQCRTGEEGLFSMSLGYSEDSNTLTVEVFGGCREVHAWRALSKVLSVMIKMLEKFPGLPCQATFCCPLHKTKSMPIRTTDARPGSRLVEASYFCPLCQDRAAGVDFLAVALQVVEFSDEKFFDAELCRGFAENAENMALRGRALWPGANFEVPAPNHISLSDEVSAPDHTSVGHQNEALFGALEQAFTIMATACFAAFGGLVSVSTAKLWAPFLAFGLFCSLAAAASVLRKWYGQFGSWGTTGSAGGVDRSRPMNAPTNV